jgi:hypothetical protein
VNKLFRLPDPWIKKIDCLEKRVIIYLAVVGITRRKAHYFTNGILTDIFVQILSDPDILIQEIFYPMFALWDKLNEFNTGKVKFEAYKYAPEVKPGQLTHDCPNNQKMPLA